MPSMYQNFLFFFGLFFFCLPTPVIAPRMAVTRMLGAHMANRDMFMGIVSERHRVTISPTIMMPSTRPQRNAFLPLARAVICQPMPEAMKRETSAKIFVYLSGSSSEREIRHESIDAKIAVRADTASPRAAHKKRFFSWSAFADIVLFIKNKPPVVLINHMRRKV